MKESVSPGQKPALGAAWIWFFSRVGHALVRLPLWPQPPCGVYWKVLSFL